MMKGKSQGKALPVICNKFGIPMANYKRGGLKPRLESNMAAEAVPQPAKKTLSKNLMAMKVSVILLTLIS